MVFSQSRKELVSYDASVFIKYDYVIRFANSEFSLQVSSVLQLEKHTLNIPNRNPGRIKKTILISHNCIKLQIEQIVKCANIEIMPNIQFTKLFKE